jgi:hypothetical protein
MKSPLSRSLATVGLVLLGVVLLGIAIWGVLALVYSEPLPGSLRTLFAALYGIASLLAVIALVLPRWRWRAVGSYLALFALLVVCWFQIPASNERQWRTEVAVPPLCPLRRQPVTVHSIRFDYRTETDFTPAYYDHTLTSADSVTCSPSTGWPHHHGIISFGFSDGHYLAVSIEARSSVGEGYSTIKGFFRQYELYYVVADERDVIRLRTNYRHDPIEHAYLFRLVGAPGDERRAFMNYINKINALKAQPEFYNTLTTNCITGIWQNAKGNAERPPFSWKLLLSGHAPQYLYEEGKLDTSVPFAQLFERGHINARAQAADKAPDFSQRIRAAAPAQ